MLAPPSRMHLAPPAHHCSNSPSIRACALCAQICTLLFCALFVYDLGFVFLSPYLFKGHNVMVEAATKQARSALAAGTQRQGAP